MSNESISALTMATVYLENMAELYNSTYTAVEVILKSNYCKNENCKQEKWAHTKNSAIGDTWLQKAGKLRAVPQTFNRPHFTTLHFKSHDSTLTLELIKWTVICPEPAQKAFHCVSFSTQ